MTHEQTPPPVPSTDPAAVPMGRHETEAAERIDRNLAELLQELRVAGLGVQVLFGFLLAMPFTTMFSSLDPEQHRLYVTVLLARRPRHRAPDRAGRVPPHRLPPAPEARRVALRERGRAGRAGRRSRSPISGAVLLVVSVVYDGLVAAIIAARRGGRVLHALVRRSRTWVGGTTDY